MRHIFSLLAVPLVGLTGCSSAVIQTPTLSSTPSNTYQEFYDANDFKEPGRAKFYLHPLPTRLADIANDAKSIGITNPQSKEFRDYLQNDLLKRSDQICTMYITRLVHNFVQGNAGLKIGESLVKALLVPVAVADSSFQALSGSLQTNLSNDVLQHELFKGVLANIVKRRAATRTAILTNQEKSVGGSSGYSVSRALYDAENYHSQCNYAVQYVSGESDPTPPPPATPGVAVVAPKAVIKGTAGGK